jgi:DNA-nicking Smr family endonuclease
MIPPDALDPDAPDANDALDPDALDALDPDAPVHIPIDGILDLHMFHPRDVKELVPDYLEACREKGIYRVRIIHGKGTGALRRTVHSILDRIPWVADYHFAEDHSSWGATIVNIAP